jgi:hypothetical protein
MRVSDQLGGRTGDRSLKTGENSGWLFLSNGTRRQHFAVTWFLNELYRVPPLKLQRLKMLYFAEPDSVGLSRSFQTLTRTAFASR